MVVRQRGGCFAPGEGAAHLEPGSGPAARSAEPRSCSRTDTSQGASAWHLNPGQDIKGKNDRGFFLLLRCKTTTGISTATHKLQR